MIIYEMVTLDSGTIYSETKDWKICRLGDTVILGQLDDTRATGFSKVLHIPWDHVREAIVKNIDISSAAPDGYRKLVKIGVNYEKKPSDREY